MRIAFYLAHPAHFHLFKHVISRIATKKKKILVLYNNKDVLHDLVKDIQFNNVKVKRVYALSKVNSQFHLKIQFIQKLIGALWSLMLFRPKLVIGTPIIIALLGKVLRYKSIIVNEDDVDVVKKTSSIGYPFANLIVCPTVCRTGKFEEKSLKYEGYHELAYLHPSVFTASNVITKQYVRTEKPYMLMRFAKLTAHHDVGIRGINVGLALKIIDVVKPHMNVFISSERQLEPELEPYRIIIDPVDMHHVMAFAEIYVGDSQTMAAESAVLGVPFVRCNDFVGKISYLDELENHYLLGYGISPSHTDELLEKVKEIVYLQNRKKAFNSRKEKMIKEKIKTSDFLTWLIDTYPESVQQYRKDSKVLNRFMSE